MLKVDNLNVYYGKIHAVGNHESLLENDPIYQEIYASQMKGEEDHGGPSAQR